MRGAIALFLILLFGCATTIQPPGYNLLPLSERSPVEQSILRHYRYIASLNASVGEEPIAFVLDRPELTTRLRNLLGTRVRHDLPAEQTSAPDATYMLIGERGSDFVVFVVPIRRGATDDTYVPLPGLAYHVDKRDYRVHKIRSVE